MFNTQHIITGQHFQGSQAHQDPKNPFQATLIIKNLLSPSTKTRLVPRLKIKNPFSPSKKTRLVL